MYMYNPYTFSDISIIVVSSGYCVIGSFIDAAGKTVENEIIFRQTVLRITCTGSWRDSSVGLVDLFYSKYLFCSKYNLYNLYETNVIMAKLGPKSKHGQA